MQDRIHWFSRPVPLDSLADLWRQAYRANRYLVKLSDDQLNERTADILSNLMVLGDDGIYRPRRRVREDGIYTPIRGLDFLRIATDAWEEYHLRGPAVANSRLDDSRLQLAKRLSDESWCRRPEWITRSRLSLDKYEQPRMLFRFSKSEWNRDFLEKGRLRLSPASGYDEYRQPNAVRDDELRFTSYDASLTPHVLTVPDYFCVSMSSEYDYRLFNDFRRDWPASCVAIRDPAAFSVRLRQSVIRHNKLHPPRAIACLTHCPIIYYDPFLIAPAETSSEVQFCKHFRFAYQTEFRHVLIPAFEGPLEPFFVDVGSITDIAEMVTPPVA